MPPAIRRLSVGLLGLAAAAFAALAVSALAQWDPKGSICVILAIPAFLLARGAYRIATAADGAAPADPRVSTAWCLIRVGCTAASAIASAACLHAIAWAAWLAPIGEARNQPLIAVMGAAFALLAAPTALWLASGRLRASGTGAIYAARIFFGCMAPALWIAYGLGALNALILLVVRPASPWGAAGEIGWLTLVCAMVAASPLALAAWWALRTPRASIPIAHP